VAVTSACARVTVTAPLAPEIAIVAVAPGCNATVAGVAANADCDGPGLGETSGGGEGGGVGTGPV
jgi:hypothetical protein